MAEGINGVVNSIGLDINSHDLMNSVSNPTADIRLAADILTLATVVYAADRLAVRYSDEICQIHIKAAVWNPEVFNTHHIQTELQKIMFWYTGDNWSFEWNQCPDSESLRPVTQRSLFEDEVAETALWSGGLDSEVGLLNRILADSTRKYILVGTGANDAITGAQRNTAQAVSDIYPSLTELIQVKFGITNRANVPLNSTQRSRGFVFILIGAIAAWLRNQKSLYIYENGYGAINLPYRASEIGLDHSRSVHPNSLWMMEKLISSLLSEHFSIHNPFLMTTKAQMCEVLLPHYQDHPELISATTSCDSSHRQLDLPAQCGYCSSCLLRRQSLEVNNITDTTKYAIHHKSLRDSHSLHLRTMLRQVRTLGECIDAGNSWAQLAMTFPMISEVLTPVVISNAGSVKAAQDAICELYLNYVQEWNGIGNTFDQHVLWGAEQITSQLN